MKYHTPLVMVISNNADLKSNTNLQFNLGTRLYKLQQQEKKLTSQVIKYLQKCFAYAFNQNKGNPEGVRNAILNIVQHAYGEHGQCGDWCQFRKDPTAKYKSLPRGLALEGDSLRLVLNNVFAIYARNAEKLQSWTKLLRKLCFWTKLRSRVSKISSLFAPTPPLSMLLDETKHVEPGLINIGCRGEGDR